MKTLLELCRRCIHKYVLQYENKYIPCNVHRNFQKIMSVTKKTVIWGAGNEKKQTVKA